LDYAKIDPHSWKWVVVSLHSALQGACVCHLTTTAHPVGALTEANTREWLDYFENSRTDPSTEAPTTYLKSLPGLLKAVRKPNSSGDGSQGSGIEISDQELQWLKRIHDDVRNQFVHFRPKSWSIDVSGIPELCRLIARIVESILNAGWAFRHLEDVDRAKLRSDLGQFASTTVSAG